MCHLVENVPDEYRRPLLRRVRDRVLNPPLLRCDAFQLLFRRL